MRELFWLLMKFSQSFHTSWPSENSFHCTKSCSLLSCCGTESMDCSVMKQNKKEEEKKKRDVIQQLLRGCLHPQWAADPSIQCFIHFKSSKHFWVLSQWVHDRPDMKRHKARFCSNDTTSQLMSAWVGELCKDKRRKNWLQSWCSTSWMLRKGFRMHLPPSPQEDTSIQCNFWQRQPS